MGTANNMQGAIAFCFFSIFAWVACAFFAFQRFRVGADAAFAPAYEVEGAVGSPGAFPAYPSAPDPQPAYSDPPFSQTHASGKLS
ncbi:hypothetical protein HF086_007267 [Spodoptera exigua]|uniref:Uncharacterized protein n=1 Tax=Spodoptera exigua TaxID=7107 RepID=A0A922SKE3_SPOEX|nr:hypothetical protein HF086_007267 [Spodoptera exigua]